MNVGSIQRALAELQKQAGESNRSAAPDVDLDGIIRQLSETIDGAGAQEGLKKEAYLRRRSNLLMAKMLAGVDALVSQR